MHMPFAQDAGTHCYYSQRVANIKKSVGNVLKCVANIQKALITFKHVLNISTALYSQRIVN